MKTWGIRTAAFVLVSVFMFGQHGFSQATTATISGTVKDSTGAVLPGASVTVMNEDTGISRQVTANATGRYSAAALPLGNYRVTASLEGFQSEVRSGIVLTVGREAVVNFDLPVGAVTQTLEVVGEAPLVETTKSSVDFLVNDTTVRELPLNGRDLAQLVLLNPGVAPSEIPHNTQSYYGFGKLLSFAGFKSEDNLYLLDGTDVNQYDNRLPAGASGTLFGAETVREFEVKTSTFAAQYGRALGGVMNAVSKSGTNAYNGSVFEFLRNSKLDARDFFDLKERPDDPRLPPFKRNQFGATMGGPIVRDRTFFFAGYEGLRQRRGVTTIYDVPDEGMRQGILPNLTASQCTAGGNGQVLADGRCQVSLSTKVAPYLALFPQATPGGKNFGDGTAQFIFVDPQRATEDFAQARVDHQLSDADSLYGRFTIMNSEFVQTERFPPDSTIAGVMKSRFVTLSETHIISPAALNTFRFAFNRTAPGDVSTHPTWPAELLSVPNQDNPPLLGVSGLETLGGSQKPRNRFITNRFEFVDDINLNRGNHNLQFGVNFQRMQFNMEQPERPNGQWSFNSLRNFLLGVPSQYRGTPDVFGDFIRGFRQNFIGTYIQDDWRVTPNLTLNLGLRWDVYSVPTEVNGKLANLRHLGDLDPTVGNPYWKNRSWKDFGPRFGFAWSPGFGGGTTAIRGGFGIFYSRADSQLYWTPTTRDGVFAPSFRQNNPNPAFFPHALDVINFLLGAGGSKGTAIPVSYEKLETPSGYQWNLTVQRQVGDTMVVSAGYAGSRGINATSTGNYNVPLLTFVNDSLRVPNGATRLNPPYSSIEIVGTGMSSWYNAFQLNVQRRLAAGFQFQVAYTFSKAINMADANYSAGSIPGEGNVLYAHEPGIQKGLSGIHVKNLFTSNYVYELPFGSGRPWLSDAGVLTHVLGNWDLNGIVTLKSGQPFTLTVGTPSALSGLVGGRRPNVVSGVAPVVWGDPGESSDPTGQDRYFDPTAGFANPSDTRALGNLGRHTMIGPGVANFDFGLNKNIPLTEAMRLQFRAEFFNLLNHANFSNPSSSLYNGSGVPSGNAGVIDSTTTKPREIQFGLKLLF
ncbi:MAG: TonB-dependent receptor [Acidobacteria bacterium]|nr:TonB-dependent receptor [Acidobacteriota bacterium]